MNDGGEKERDYKKALVRYWVERARESLESADSEYRAGRLSPAVRSTYYACFYAVSAVLCSEGKLFKKHSAVRGALHRDLIKTGKVDASWGRFYDTIFDSRHRGDYQPMINFESEQVGRFIDSAKGFARAREDLLKGV